MKRQYKAKQWLGVGFFLVVMFFIVSMFAIRAQEQQTDNILTFTTKVLNKLVRAESAMDQFDLTINQIQIDVGDLQRLLMQKDFDEATSIADRISDSAKYATDLLTSVDSIDFFPKKQNTVKKEILAIKETTDLLKNNVDDLISVSDIDKKFHLLNIALKWLSAQSIQSNIFNDQDLLPVDLTSRLLEANKNVTYFIDEFKGYLELAQKDEKTKISVNNMLSDLITIQNSTSDLFNETKSVAENLALVNRQIERLHNNLEGDLTGDGKVDIFDLVIVAKNFGKKIQ